MPMRMHTYRGFNRIDDMICEASNDYCSELSIGFDGDSDLACRCNAMECDSILVPPPPMAAPRVCLLGAMPSPPTVGSRLSRNSRKSPMLSCRLIAQSADRMDDIDTYKQKKKSVEHHYERLEKTKEYQEGYYYQSTEVFSPVSLVPNSAFWASFAHHLRSGSPSPFLSKDFILCTHSVSEVIFCLSVCVGDSE